MHVEDYMNETPACLLAMLTQTREDLWQAAKALTERGVTRIILTGSGTSYHGALTARSFMQQWCGLPVDVYWPFLLDDSALTLSDKALVIGISQGGGSLSTLAAMEYNPANFFNAFFSFLIKEQHIQSFGFIMCQKF